MSGKSLVLAVKIIGDATDAIKAMDQAAGKSDQFGNRLNTAAKVGAVALGAITGAALSAGHAASELEQATGAVSSVFGQYAGEMMQHAEKAADAVGLSQTEYGNTASILGAQLKNMGLSMKDTAGTTDNLITLGADLAATFGGTTADATSALASLLRGERDPIEKYGVSIKQADIEAQKAAMGLDGLTGEAAKNADLQATLALLTKQTADAQGQFARETDSAAGSAQIASANFENARAALGEALLPVMTQAAEVAADLARWFQENAAWITPLIGVIAGLAAAVIVINGAYKAFVAVQAMQTAAQWASNAAWLASPITWIVLAIIAAIAILVAVIVVVVKHWDQIKAAGVAAFQTVIGWVKQAVSWLGEKFAAPIRNAMTFFTNLKNGAVAVFQTIISWVKSAIDWIANLAANAIPGWAKDLLGMSRAAPMSIQPEVLGFDAPAYAARMAVTPFAAPITAPPVEQFAPMASANLSIMSALVGAITTPRIPQQPAQAVYEDRRQYTITLPNYMGDREEVIEEIRDGLKELDRKESRFVSA